MKYSIVGPSSSLRNGVLLRWITIIKKIIIKKRLFHYEINLINENSFFTIPNRIKPKTNFTSKSINSTKTTEKIIALAMRICSRTERFTRALYVWMHFMVIIRRTCREEVCDTWNQIVQTVFFLRLKNHVHTVKITTDPLFCVFYYIFF